ncbi:MAG: NUDIX hydrolase [Oscillochloridaceae bacterium umkhey_bin13]
MSVLDQQIAALRRSMAEPPSLDAEDLLIVRDLTDRPLRPSEPPTGVIPRYSAALLLLYPHNGELWLPLTVRSARVTTHRGEVSLPGGGRDPEDADLHATALREAHEELGIHPGSVEVLGTLSAFYIAPSNNILTPVVGLGPAEPTLSPDPHEVEAAFSVPLRELFEPSTIREEIWELRGMQLRIPFFALAGYKVWGATAFLLSELVARMRRSRAY